MPTYKPIQSITLTSDTSSVLLSGIDQNYTDLKLIIKGTITSNNQTYRLQFNQNTSGYSYATVGTTSGGNATYIGNGLAYFNTMIMNGTLTTSLSNVSVDIHSYADTAKVKSVLIRANDGNSEVQMISGTWNNTSAINSITVLTSAGNLAAGTTIDLYGISPVAAQVASAFGGTDIFYDSSYVYHVFKGTGTFTPTRSLTADVLIVAGGGGGGGDIGGGGGAGGLRTFTSQALTAQSYPIIIGAGGVGGPSSTSGTKGGNSSAFGNSSTGGGFGALYDTVGGNGGSGGGNGRRTANPPAGNQGGYSPVEGYAGAAGSNFTSDGSAGGGGGAGGAGVFNASGPSNGGIGFTSSLTNAMGAATGTGILSGGNYYYAGGGGGGSGAGATASSGGLGGGGVGGAANQSLLAGSGITSTGSGGGGGSNGNGVGANGGSGIVIVRYAR